MCYAAVHAPGRVIIAIVYWKKYWLVIFSSLWFRVGNRLHPLGAYTFNERERARYSKWFLCNWITGNEQKVCCHETQAVPLIVVLIYQRNRRMHKGISFSIDCNILFIRLWYEVCYCYYQFQGNLIMVRNFIFWRNCIWHWVGRLIRIRESRMEFLESYYFS